MQIKDKILDVPVIQGGMGVGVSLSSLAGAVAASGAVESSVLLMQVMMNMILRAAHIRLI